MPLAMAENEGWFADRQSTRPDLDRFEWAYFSEDSATIDEDGYLTLLGRVDDVINVAGHSFGIMEIESAIANAKGVAKAAVVSGPHDVKGQGIYVYVCTADGSQSQMPWS